MEKGQPPLYIVLNAAPEPIDFVLPTVPKVGHWTALLNTAASQDQQDFAPAATIAGAGSVRLGIFGGGMNGPRFGAELDETGVTFRLWAPAANSVDLGAGSAHARCTPGPAAGTNSHVTEAGAGTLYKFRIDDELEVPDPASHFQPHDVSGPSEVIDHAAYRWQRRGLARPARGRMPSFLELHVGTFTPDGTFRAAIEKLDHVRRHRASRRSN